MTFRHPRLRLLLAVPPVVLGVVLFVVLGAERDPPTRSQAEAPPVPVRVLTVPRVTVLPLVVAYGPVQPDRVWQGVAEVSGRLVEVAPVVRRGTIVPAGTPLIRIDPSDYRLTLAQREAQLRDLTAQRDNVAASIAIEERSLDLARRDLGRKETLGARGAVAQSAVDEARRATLASEQTLQSLRNTLNLIPAQIAQVQAQIDQARLDLARTTLVAPFDLRIAEAEVTEGRYAQRGEILIEGDSIARAEVEAQVPLDRMLALSEGAPGLATRPDPAPKDADRDGAGGAAPASDSGDRNGTAARLEAIGLASRDMHRTLGLTAEVRLRAGSRIVSWTGRVERISDTVDPRTRTIGVIVVVEDPYRQAEPGVRPPLVKNMFVEVALHGAPRPDRVVVPRQAVREGRVVLVGADNRLVSRPVTLGFVQGGYAIVDQGLEGGETLVLSDLSPAVDGMALDPHPDVEAGTRLIAEATGTDPMPFGASDPGAARKEDGESGESGESGS